MKVLMLHVCSGAYRRSFRRNPRCGCGSMESLTKRRKTDLDKLEEWSEENKMQFNKDEVKVPLLGTVSSTNAEGGVTG